MIAADSRDRERDWLQRMVHGDIKPDNLLMDDSERLKVCDFGWTSALRADGTLTFKGCLGTRGYGAPELLLGTTRTLPRGREPHLLYGTPADMWAIGCVMVRLRSWPSPTATCNYLNGPFERMAVKQVTQLSCARRIGSRALCCGVLGAHQ